MSRVAPWLQAAFGAAAGTLATRAASTVLTARPPGGAERWTRTNHRGEPISLLAGLAWVAGTAGALAVVPGLPARLRTAALAATTTAGALGAYDDLAEGAVSKGLAGHLGALARGELTTGAVKVLGLGAGGLAAAALLPAERGGDAARGAVGRAADVLVAGAVVAGTANLLNLLDLRPGRALKVSLVPLPLAALAGSAGRPATIPAAVAAGAAVALLPDDLGERTMLGDTGANAVGALLGVAALAATGRRGRLALLAGLVALTAASERISFTRVIERTPLLRELDALGRRPPGRSTR